MIDGENHNFIPPALKIPLCQLDFGRGIHCRLLQRFSWVWVIRGTTAAFFLFQIYSVRFAMIEPESERALYRNQEASVNAPDLPIHQVPITHNSKTEFRNCQKINLNK